MTRFSQLTDKERAAIDWKLKQDYGAVLEREDTAAIAREQLAAVPERVSSIVREYELHVKR